MALRLAGLLVSGLWFLAGIGSTRKPETSNQKPAATSPATAGSPFASHMDSPLEWWYWTGHLSGSKGRAYGFQVTFFRLRDFHLAHFACSEETNFSKSGFAAVTVFSPPTILKKCWRSPPSTTAPSNI